MGDLSDANQSLVDLFRRLIAENYMILATSILLFCDHASTFMQEVETIWRRKFSGATLLFLVTRYSATVERVVLLLSLFLKTTADTSCVPVLRLDDALTDLNMLAIGAFMAVRIYAIWGQNICLFLFMMLFVLARVAISLWFQTHYAPIAFGAPLYGCGGDFHMPTGLYNHLHVAGDAVGLASDILLLVLTWIKTLEISRASARVNIRTPITTLLLRDGTLYFIVVFFLQVMSIVGQQIGSDFELFQVWTYWNQSITVIFLCRFMLNLRNVHVTSYASSRSTFAGGASTINFHPSAVGSSTLHADSGHDGERQRGSNRGKSTKLGRFVGNLGAPLSFGPSENVRDEGFAQFASQSDSSAHRDHVGRPRGNDLDGVGEELVVVDGNPLAVGLFEQPVEARELAEIRIPA